ncbi:hypothetical protein LZ30DRAFT_380306 [Colletotrichum cereale]|nr:hypothetical protein LZ30DRAFT_380306 [Colletotrichum cereale]
MPPLPRHGSNRVDGGGPHPAVTGSSFVRRLEADYSVFYVVYVRRCSIRYTYPRRSFVGDAAAAACLLCLCLCFCFCFCFCFVSGLARWVPLVVTRGRGMEESGSVRRATHRSRCSATRQMENPGSPGDIVRFRHRCAGSSKVNVDSARQQGAINKKPSVGPPVRMHGDVVSTLVPGQTADPAGNHSTSGCFWSLYE